MNYTDEESEQIRKYDSDQLAQAVSEYQTADHELRDASVHKRRWDDPAFVGDVRTAQKDRWKWMLMIDVIVVSYLMNCFLVQELTGDFAPLATKFVGLTGGVANFAATIVLTSLVFGFLLLIKDQCDTTYDLAALRAKSHPAVSTPIRKRIAWKIGVKVFYLIALALGYRWLFAYIAGGVEIEQQIHESAESLRSASAANLSGLAPDLTDIDAEIASTQAASFAFYYCVEWLLHAAILFLGVSFWAPANRHLSKASQKRDVNIWKVASTRQSKAHSKLVNLCQPRNPDDGLNSLRAAALKNIGNSTGDNPPAAESTSIPKHPTTPPTASNCTSTTTNGFPSGNRLAAF